tara:strand:- start:1622 stop:1969 length:348 start_codon:yes stop_codon:yes gene_type:complete
LIERRGAVFIQLIHPKKVSTRNTQKLQLQKKPNSSRSHRLPPSPATTSLTLFSEDAESHPVSPDCDVAAQMDTGCRGDAVLCSAMGALHGRMGVCAADGSQLRQKFNLILNEIKL